VYPKQWIKQKDGSIRYDSINTNAKKVLAHLHTLYEKGILDKHFLLRTSDNIADEITSGKCGAFFGPWWVPNNPLIEAVKKNPKIEWTPYRIETNANGITSYHSVKPSSKYVVVRKGFKHPEIIFKIISVIFDYLRYDNKKVSSINRYYALNVDPTARPISINVDYRDALKRSYRSIQWILDGNKVTKNISSIDVSYASACQSYLNNAKSNQAENWAAYISRIRALKLIDTKKVKRVECVNVGADASTQKTYMLTQLENQTYLKIISGKASVDSFNRFVKDWKKNGGDALTKQVEKDAQSKSS
jgi:putative aldouronate transport system substrate-binding protein